MSRTIPIELSTEDHQLITRAAALAGFKKSEFIVYAARKAATNAILDERVLLATTEQFDQITNYLNENGSDSTLENALDKAKSNPLW